MELLTLRIFIANKSKLPLEGNLKYKSYVRTIQTVRD